MSNKELSKGGKNSSQKALKHGSFRWIRWMVKSVAVLLLFIIFVLPVTGWGLYHADKKWGVVSAMLDLPDLSQINKPFIQTSWVRARGNEIIGCYAEEYRIPIVLSDKNKILQNAVIASEDQNFDNDNAMLNFFLRPGYDVRSITRAMAMNIAAGHWVQGGSTIGQQLIKNRVLNSERTFNRKLKEAFLAMKMQEKFSRNEVLEMYINMVYLGGPYGFEAAAQTYYRKSANALTVDEAAVLAGMINDSRPLVALFRTPDIEKQAQYRAYIKARRDRVLGYMRRKGSISEAELEAALEKPINIRPFVSACEKRSPYLSEMVRTRFESQLEGLHTGGYQIKTTIDIAYQHALERACELELTSYVKRHPENAGTIRCSSMAVETKTGAVRALVAGQDFSKDQYNGVTQSKRQPGSAFKPFLYASLLEKIYERRNREILTHCASLSASDFLNSCGASLMHMDLLDECVLYDNSLAVPNIVGTKGRIVTSHFIRNYPYENKVKHPPYLGRTSCLRALAESRNAATMSGVLMLSDPYAELSARWKMGVREVINTAHVLGIDSELPPGPATVLGAGEVTIWEMARAYAPFVNGGCRMEPSFVESVANAKGEVLFERSRAFEKKCARVLQPKVAEAMRRLLQEVVDSDVGTAHALRERFPSGGLAGKTGTSTNEDGTSSTDNWFIGITPKLIVVTRINNVDKTGLGKHETGGKNAVPVFAEFISSLHLLDSKEEFQEVSPFLDGVPYKMIQVKLHSDP